MVVGTVDRVYVAERARAYGHQMPAPPRQAAPAVPRSAISLLNEEGLRQRHLQQLRLAAGQYRKHMLVDVKTAGQGLSRPVTRERKPIVLPPDPPPKSPRTADYTRRSRPVPRRPEGKAKRDGASSASARTVEPQLFGRALERPQTTPHTDRPQAGLSTRRPGSGRLGALPQQQMMKMMVGVVDLDSTAREDAISARVRLSHGARAPRPPRNELVRASAPASTSPPAADKTASPPVDWMVVEESLQQDLLKLLERLRTQRDSGDEFDPSLLAAFRHCFQRLIDKFRAYRPLMSMLKSVYDSHLDEWSGLALNQRNRNKEANARLSETDAIESQSSTENAKEFEKLSNLLETARQKKQEAESKRLARVQELAAAKAKHFAMRLELTQLDEAQEALRAGGRRKNQELAKELQRLDIKFGATWAIRDRRDTIRKNKNTAETGLADCERLLRLRKQELVDANKELEKWESERTSLRHELDVAADETVSLGDKIGSIELKLRNMKRGRGDVTPRPDWDEAAEVLPDKVETEKPSRLLAEDVTAQIATLRNELKTTLEELAASKSAQAMRAEDGDHAGDQHQDNGTKWFVCKGTGSHVPRFLRATGKVRNRRWSKIKLEELIEEFWAKKILRDARHDTEAISVPDYFYEFLKQKVGDSKLITEWGYNIADSCRRYSRDADVEIFSLSLFGDLPEAAYHGQMKMISDIEESARLLDRKEHGGRTTETVDRMAFNKMLKEMFAYKSDDDMKALQQALSYDQPLPVISYVKLFESDRTGDQGRFAETLRDQYVSEAQAVYPEVEQCLRSVLAEFADSSMPDTQLLMPAQHMQYVKQLSNVPFFKAFRENEISVLLGSAEHVEFSPEQQIIAEGGQARWIFILVGGTATATMEMLPSYKKEYNIIGEFFGEQLLLKRHKFRDHPGVPLRRAATIVAGELGARCLVIRPSADIDEQLLTKNFELLERARRGYDQLEQDFVAANGETEHIESMKTISPPHVRMGLERFDQEMPEIEKDRILAVVFNVAIGAPLPDTLEVPVSTVMERLRTITIPRFSKQANSDGDDEKREKYLRSLPDEEREAIAVCFDELDHDFSGTLSKDEMAELLERTYGMKPTKNDVAKLMAAVDTSGDGSVNLEEFIEAMATVPALQHAADVYKWRQTFNEFDKDESGFLDSEELKQMAKQLWLPNAPGSPSGGLSRSLSRTPSPTTVQGLSPRLVRAMSTVASDDDDNDDEPDAVKLLLQLAAEKDDGDGEISWEEFLDLMQSLFHN